MKSGCIHLGTIRESWLVGDKRQPALAVKFVPESVKHQVHVHVCSMCGCQASRLVHVVCNLCMEYSGTLNSLVGHTPDKNTYVHSLGRHTSLESLNKEEYWKHMYMKLCHMPGPIIKFS